MKTFFLSIALALACCAGSFAQGFTVVVSPFDARGGVSASDGESVAELIAAELAADGTVQVVDRASFDKIMAEMRFQQSDLADNAKVEQLGKALGANVIVRGSVMTLGGQVAVAATMLDMSTVQIIGSSRMQVKTLDEIFDKLTPFVKDMTTALNKARVFKVGDKGPGGGIVFFVEGDVRKEVSPFLGVDNWVQAPVIATNYKGGGYADWRLPSLNELKQIYENLQKSGVANLLTREGDSHRAGAGYNYHSNNYWSSNEDSFGLMFLSLTDGAEQNSPEGLKFCIRAVRQF